jgi:hypothetical protein
MRRTLAPTIVLAGIGLLAGGIYRYVADDPGEATLANYIRSSLHGRREIEQGSFGHDRGDQRGHAGHP